MATILSKSPEILLSDNVAEVPYRQAPSNIEAEQALLGALLVNNEALQHIGDNLRAEHFYEPLHARIFEAIQKFQDKGQVANPITLRHYFDQDEALSDIGGGTYLAKLAAAAVIVINVRDYSQMIYDLAIKRQLIALGEEVVNTAYTHQIDIPATNQIESAEQKLFNLSMEGGADKGFRALRHSVLKSVEQTDHALKHHGSLVGITTGLEDLDKMLGGLKRSDLLILAGRPSMGKTALAVNVAYKAGLSLMDKAKKAGLTAKEAGSVGFFSLEMSAEQLSTRMLSSASKINSYSMLNGRITPEEFTHLVHVSKEMSQMPFFIDDTPALSISALRTRARRLQRMHNLKLLVVDYLQLVRGSASSSENRVQEISEITQGLKAIAKELDIPVIALSQLSRAVENRGTKARDKIPQLADLRDSGSIEQDADVVMFIYREEYYLAREQPKEGTTEHATWMADMDKVMNVAEVIIAKHRNGPIGNVKLRFDANLTQFDNLAEGY